MRTPLRALGVTAAFSLAAAAVPLLSSADAQAAGFTGGDLVVYRVGNGTGTLTNAAAPVFLDEFGADGTRLGSTALPTTATGGQRPLTAAGQSRSEGLISTSVNGLVALTGYAAAPGTTGPGGASLTTSDPAQVARVVGVVDGHGTVDTSTTLGAAAPHIVRSAVTDGTRVWAAGGEHGILTSALGSGTVSTVADDDGGNVAALSVQAGQLFASGLLEHRLAKVGTGAPAGAATLTDLDGLPENLLTYGYAFVDATSASYAGTSLDTLYVANSSERGGTVDKYRWTGSTWTSAGFVDLPGATGLVAALNGASVSLAVTTPTQLLTLTDPSAASTGFAPSAAQVLATAAAGTEFRGVALAPTGTLGVPDGALAAGRYAWTDKRVATTGTWKRYAYGKAPGGKGLTSKKKGSTATVQVVGSQLAITFSTAPTGGRAVVTVDGHRTTVDTKASKAGTLVKKLPLGGSDAHTVTVKVAGSAPVSLALLQVK